MKLTFAFSSKCNSKLQQATARPAPQLCLIFTFSFAKVKTKAWAKAWATAWAKVNTKAMAN